MAYDLDALEAGYQQHLKQQAAVAPQPAKKPGNFFTHLFPTIGGIGGGAAGGAAGGALAGTAILPGIGTAVGALGGALIGGFAGGATGKAVENGVEGQAIGNGVIGQGLEQGVLSAGPLKLLKAGKAVAGVAKPGVSLAEALANADTKVAAPGIISKVRSAVANKGAQTEARAGGFGIGEKASGSKPLGYYDSAQILSNLKNEGIKAGSPEVRLKQVEDAMNTRGQQLDLHLLDNNVALKPVDTQYIVNAYNKAIENQPGVDDLARKQAQNLITNFANQAKDLRGVVDFRRGLDDQVINFTQNPDTGLAAKQLAARTLRDVINKNVEKVAPGIADLNRSYSNLADAKGFLVGGSKAVSDNSQSAGGGVIGRVLASDTAQGVKSKAGSVMQGAAPKVVPSSPFGIGGQILRQAPTGLAGALLSQANNTSSNSAGQNPNIATNTATNAMNNSANIDTSYQNSADTSSTSQDNTSPYSLDALNADVQRDPKNADKYFTLFQEYQKAYAAPKASTATGFTKPTAQQYSQAATGLQSLQALASILQTDPSVVGKNASTPGQNLPLGIGSHISGIEGTSQYRAITGNILNSIARINTGANMPESERVFYENSYLPQPGDNDQTKQQKLQTLYQFFAPLANYQQSSTANSDDLSSALQQAGYSQ